MTTKLALSSTPEGIVPALLAHLNSLDVETMLGFYDPEGLIVDAAGSLTSAGTPSQGALQYFSLGLQMSITPAHLFVAGAVAPLSSSTGRTSHAKDGTDDQHGSHCDGHRRRGPDGLWRYPHRQPVGSMQRSAG